MSYQNAYLTNTKIRLMNELSVTSYLPNMKDYIVNLIIQLISYQFKSPTQNARYSINNFFGQDKIVMVTLPMSIPFNNRSFDVPIQIYLMKNIPYEPPQIFIEVNQSTGINTKNTDIDANTKRIVEIIAGATIGRVILPKIFILEALRITAASSKFASIFLNIPPIKI